MSIIGTTILGGVGTLIGKYFQDRMELKKRAREKRANELKTADEIFSGLSTQMDEYLYRMKEVYDGFNHGVEPKEKEKRWAKFQEEHSQWKITLNLVYSKILKYFGEKMAVRFNDICDRFTTLRRELDKLYYEEKEISDLSKDADGEVSFISDRNSLAEYIREYNIKMLHMIEKEDVGALR